MLKRLERRRPSASMVLAVLGLVVAASGTAVAASHLVSGDSLIKKHSLSGNRLKNHTITGKQVNVKKLGTVPKAKNASELGGQSASSFVSSSQLQRTGGMVMNHGQTSTVLHSGALSVIASCSSSGSTTTAALAGKSTTGKWLLGGTEEAATGSKAIGTASGASETGHWVPIDVGDGSGDTINGSGVLAANYPSSGHCYFSLVAASS